MAEVFVSHPRNAKTPDSEEHTELVQYRSRNPLTCFAYEPKNAHFLDQDPQEKIILFLRWHPITNLGWILIAFVMFLAPTVFPFFPIISALPLSFRVVISLLWYLLAIAYTYEKFLHWYYSAFLVTNKRVIDIDFENLIYRQVSFASLDKIQDVTVKAGGAVMAVFNYGDVYIQTAAEVENIEFEKIPKPDKVIHVLRGLILAKEQKKEITWQ